MNYVEAYEQTKRLKEKAKHQKMERAQKLVQEGLTGTEVAERVGVDASTVRAWARKHGWRAA